MKKAKPALISVLVLAFAFSACSAEVDLASANIEENIGVAVQTENGQRRDIRREISYSGQINAQDSALVVSRLGGRVQSVYFDVGDRVNAGDVLFSLDKKDIEDQIKQLDTQLRLSETGINSAQTGLDLVTGGQTQSQILQMQTAIESQKKQVENARITVESSRNQSENAQINVESSRRQSEIAKLQLDNAKKALENVETTYDNIKILFEAGAATRNQFEEIELAYNQSLAGVEQAQLAYDQSLATIEQAQITYNQTLSGVEQAEIGYDAAILALQQAEESLNIMQGSIIGDNQRSAMLGVDQAVASRDAILVQMDIARSTLDDANVTSPISGIISAKNVGAGDLVSAQVVAYTIVDTENVLVEVKVAENLINQMSIGKEIDVYVRTIQEEPFTGVISKVSPTADHTSMFPISIEINNADGKIRPGMFAEVTFVREESVNTFVLARNVILEDESGNYIYVNNNGVAERRDVVTGIDNGREIEILEGLSENDEVIIRGHNFVRDGEAINVVD